MPPDFPQQTQQIVSCIFQNERDVYECDSVGDAFDPVGIAAKLRELGDHYDETVIQPLIREVQVASQEQVATAFSNSVESLCKMWVVERAEIVPEKQLLKATVALALYVKNYCPDMAGSVQQAMVHFLNNRLASWIVQQGGWERASFS